MADDFPASAATAGSLVGNGFATGSIEIPNDQDWLRISLNGGQSYRIDLLGTATINGTLSDPYLWGIYAASGTFISGTSDDDSGDGLNSRMTFTPNSSGTYYLAAAAYGSNTGSYRLEVSTTGPVNNGDDFSADTATAGILAPGGTVSGSIETTGDQDWFATTLTGGQSYVIDLRGADTGHGTVSDTFLRGVYTAAGALLASTTDDDGGEGLNSQMLFSPTTTATYFIAAGAYSSNTGTYQLSLAANGPSDDFLASTGTSGALAIGGSVTGTIEASGDRDWFRVSLTAGQAYVIDLRGAPNGHGTLPDTSIYGIHDSAGNEIAGTGNDDFSTLDSRVTFAAPTTGTYYIDAGAFGGNTGTYTLTIASSGPTDDFAASLDTTGKIAPGGTVDGAIERADDNDWFSIGLTGGFQYRITLNGAPTGDGTLGDTYLRGIHDSAGTAIAGTSNDDSGGSLNSAVTFIPASTGTYYIAAAAFGSNTGTYRLAVAELGAADDFAATTATTGTVGVNATASGTIETDADQDWFAVNLVTGANYQIDLLSTGAGALSDPYLHGIHTSAGALISGTENDDGGDGFNSRLNFTATATGIHYIAAGAYGSSTGRYELFVTQQATADDFAGDATTTGTVTPGSTASGSIGTAADHDWFAVALAAGTEYRIDIIGTEGNGGTLADPYLHGVRTANGTLLAGTTDDDSGESLNSRTTFIAPAAGTYYVDVGAYDIGTGTYTVALAMITAPTDDFAASTATTGQAALDTVAPGTIEIDGDQDWFRASLTSGHTYRIDLMGLASNGGTLGDPLLRGIFDAAGAPIPNTTDDDNGEGLDSRLEFTPTATGNYYLAAGGFGGGTGSYKLLLRDLGATDDFSADTATTGQAAAGANSTGAIESADDQDWFAIALTAGTIYRIELRGATTSNGTLTDPYFAGIRDSAGAPIAATTDDDSGAGLDSQLTFTATTTGTHYLAASAFGGGTGSYKLTVTLMGTEAPVDDFAATVATTGTVASDGSRTGNTEVARDQDWFAVTLVAGQTYDIGVEGTATNVGTLVDPYLRGIFNAAGTQINGTQADDGGTGLNSLHRFTAPSSGVYFVAAGAAGTGTGTYKVTVAQIAGAIPPPPADSSFNITIAFTGNEAYRSYFDAAVRSWQSIITADLPDVTDPTHGFIDDLRIDAAVVAIDGAGGILGQAGPRAVRTEGSLPYLGMMQFDEADLAGMVAKGILQDVIEHEMGHVLGMSFGMWSHLGLATGLAFTGTNAMREYATLTGAAATTVPLESGGGPGTRLHHWSESTFRTELMTGFSENAPPMPLSRLTVGALQDMGYTVNYAAAEAYVLPANGQIAAASGGLSAILGEPETPPAITGDPVVAALADDTFTGARLAFFEDKPLITSPAPAPVKLDGTITTANGTTVLFYETTTGNNYLVELIGTFLRNDPTTAGAVKGTLTGMRIHSAAGLTESYDYASSPRDAEATLNNYTASAFSGNTLVESRAASAQNDRITTGAGNDILVGALGDDEFNAGSGNDRIFGGAGMDTAHFAGTRTDYRIGIAGNVARLLGPDGEDETDDVEQLHFGDTAPITLDSLRGQPGTDELMSFFAAGRSSWVLPDLYAGPLALDYVRHGTSVGDVAGGTSRNDFMNLFEGDDAMNLGAGNDVLDGGGGSNFLTGGAGFDIFFLDARAGLLTWSTIADWETGEQLALWGWNPGVSTETWVASDGAPGYQGATMQVDIDGNGVKETYVTWSGRSIADVQGLIHDSAGLRHFY